MTALLDSPVGTLDVSLLEERQPDEPLLCTFTRFTRSGKRRTVPCSKMAQWEAMCLGCGHVFRRCDDHYLHETIIANSQERYTGQVMVCFRCATPTYIEQYVMISA